MSLFPELETIFMHFANYFKKKQIKTKLTHTKNKQTKKLNHNTKTSGHSICFEDSSPLQNKTDAVT